MKRSKWMTDLRKRQAKRKVKRKPKHKGHKVAPRVLAKRKRQRAIANKAIDRAVTDTFDILANMSDTVVAIVNGAGPHGMAQAHLLEPMIEDNDGSPLMDISTATCLLDALVSNGRITKRGAHYFGLDYPGRRPGHWLTGEPE